MLYLAIKKLIITYCVVACFSLASGFVVASSLHEADFAAKNGNDREAFAMYQDLASQGNTDARAQLGEFYLTGRGVEKDYNKGFALLKMLSEKGNIRSQVFLADQFARDGKWKNSAKWYMKAANQGDYLGQYRLGMMYKAGNGVVENYNKAIEWILISAEQGYGRAQYRLGHIYSKGDITSKDLKKAIEWYTKSAEQGMDGPYSLARIYRNMSYQSSDMVLAYKWILISAYKAQNNLVARTVNEYKEGMELREIVEAQKLATEWIEKYSQ